MDRAAYVFCVQKCESVMTDWTELSSSSKRGFSGVHGCEESAGTHDTKLDQSTGELLFVIECRDDRPIVDSGTVVSTCSVDYATSVPTEKVHYSMNLESVLGESLQHYGIKRNVPFTNRTGSTMNVNFEVTDTKHAILPVHEGCGNGSMIVFTPDRRGKIVNGKKSIEQVQQILETTPGFDIVFDRGAYVLDVDVNDGVYVNDERKKIESDSGISFLVTRTEYWEPALNQAQKDHEKKQSIEREVQGENQDTFEHVKVRVTPKPYEPTKEERQSMRPHIVLSRALCEICVKAKSPDGKHTKQFGNTEHIPVIEFDCAFATDTPGDPNRKIAMMVATDSIHGSIFAVVASRVSKITLTGWVWSRQS